MKVIHHQLVSSLPTLVSSAFRFIFNSNSESGDRGGWGVEVSQRGKIIKCHQWFDATWGQDAIFVLGSLLAAGHMDAFALLAGIFI